MNAKQPYLKDDVYDYLVDQICLYYSRKKARDTRDESDKNGGSFGVKDENE